MGTIQVCFYTKPESDEIKDSLNLGKILKGEQMNNLDLEVTIEFL